jgi:hypothetical protein
MMARRRSVPALDAALVCDSANEVPVTTTTRRKAAPLAEQLVSRRLAQIQMECAPRSRRRVLAIGTAGLVVGLVLLAVVVAVASGSWR